MEVMTAYTVFSCHLVAGVDAHWWGNWMCLDGLGEAVLLAGAHLKYISTSWQINVATMLLIGVCPWNTCSHDNTSFSSTTQLPNFSPTVCSYSSAPIHPDLSSHPLPPRYCDADLLGPADGLHLTEYEDFSLCAGQDDPGKLGRWMVGFKWNVVEPGLMVPNRSKKHVSVQYQQVESGTHYFYTCEAAVWRWIVTETPCFRTLENIPPFVTLLCPDVCGSGLRSAVMSWQMWAYSPWL